jgi:NADH:ubiquinone oxidoreductase subunit F (NADH-binding)
MAVSGDVAGHPGAIEQAAGLGRLLPAEPQQPADLDQHLHLHGPLPHLGGKELIAAVQEAGLTGRGGAAFPTYIKLQAALAADGSAVVVGNGAESEPASAKDKTLLTVSPHLVLDGLQLAAEAVRARHAYLYVHRNPELLRSLRGAIGERAGHRADQVVVRLVEAPQRFLAGEKTALASRISGGNALPRFGRPPVSERGVGGAPTLVQNVETLAHLALIARHGPGWFRELGTEAEPGTMMCTIHEPGRPVQVVETAIGTPLRSLLTLRVPVTQAVLIGGYHGTWLTAVQAVSLPLANAALRPLAAAIGAGVLAALPADTCGLAESANVVRYLALESAGQCGPCLNALPRISSALSALADLLPPPEMRANLLRWANLVEGRGACHHPDGTVRFVRSALIVFAHEESGHQQGRCSATDARPFLPVPDVPPGNRDWK